MAKKRKRVYKVFKDSPAPFEISMEDNATWYMAMIRTECPKAIGWSLKSLGNYIRLKLRRGARTRSPGGHPWVPMMPAKKRGALEGRRGRFAPWGQLIKGIGYEYSERNGGTVEIGMLSDSDVELGSKLEKGFRTTITNRMRLKYAAVGIFLKPDKKEVIAPARPLFEPVAKEVNPKIVPYIEEKLRQYRENGFKNPGRK